MIVGALLKQADLYVSEGLHPRVAVEGFHMALEKALEVRGFGLLLNPRPLMLC